MQKTKFYLMGYVCLCWLTAAHAQTRLSLLPSFGRGITQQTLRQALADISTHKSVAQVTTGLHLELRHKQWGLTVGGRLTTDAWGLLLAVPAGFVMNGRPSKYGFSGNVVRRQWVLMLDRELADIPLYRRGDAQLYYTLGLKIRPYLGITHNTTHTHKNPDSAVWGVPYRFDYDAPNYLVFQYDKRDFNYWGYTLGLGLHTYWREANLLRLDIGYQQGLTDANHITVRYALNNNNAARADADLRGAGWWVQAQWCITLWRSNCR